MQGLDPGTKVEEKTGCSRDVAFEKDAESTADGNSDQRKNGGGGRSEKSAAGDCKKETPTKA